MVPLYFGHSHWHHARCVKATRKQGNTTHLVTERARLWVSLRLLQLPATNKMHTYLYILYKCVWCLRRLALTCGKVFSCVFCAIVIDTNAMALMCSYRLSSFRCCWYFQSVGSLCCAPVDYLRGCWSFNLRALCLYAYSPQPSLIHIKTMPQQIAMPWLCCVMLCCCCISLTEYRTFMPLRYCPERTALEIIYAILCVLLCSFVSAYSIGIGEYNRENRCVCSRSFGQREGLTKARMLFVWLKC